MQMTVAPVGEQKEGRKEDTKLFFHPTARARLPGHRAILKSPTGPGGESKSS